MAHLSLTPQLLADLLVAAFFVTEALRRRRAPPGRTERTTMVFWGCYVITLLALNSTVPPAVMAAPPVAWIGVIPAAGGPARMAADGLAAMRSASPPARGMRWHAGGLAHIVFWIGAAAASLNVIAMLTVAVAMLAATGVGVSAESGRSRGSASAGH